MAAIQRIKSMGSRQIRETDSNRPFPHSLIDSDNTSMRKRYQKLIKEQGEESDEDQFDRSSKDLTEWSNQLTLLPILLGSKSQSLYSRSNFC